MIDIVIPTIKERAVVQPLVREINETAGTRVCVLATCRKVSAAMNRNIGLHWANSALVIMVDDDISGLPQNWARDLAQVMADYPKCVMASARLLDRNGSPACMVGNPSLYHEGVEILTAREVITACCIVRNDGTRFDENYKGSGFEDNDFCRQLGRNYPDGQFICHHGVKVTHANEMKNQGLERVGGRWQRTEPWISNEAYYKRKWDL